jgi:hypothetical protein
MSYLSSIAFSTTVPVTTSVALMTYFPIASFKANGNTNVPRPLRSTMLFEYIGNRDPSGA